MKRFVRKTLAIEEYDSQRKCKIYSVHDLQLDYLKFQLFRSEVSEEVAKYIYIGINRQNSFHDKNNIFI